MQTKQKKGQRRDNPPLYTPHASFPPLLSLPLLPPATFICCSINNCYCSFNYAPVISESGGHVSSPSQGSLGNYQHPSKGQCTRSLVAVAIITPLLLTSVQWTRSPSGLSLSRHAFLCQAWPLTPPLALWGVFVYSERQGHRPPRYYRFFNLNMDILPIYVIILDMWALGYSWDQQYLSVSGLLLHQASVHAFLDHCIKNSKVWWWKNKWLISTT